MIVTVTIQHMKNVKHWWTPTRLPAAPEPLHKVDDGLVLDSTRDQGPLVLQLTATEDQAHLVHGEPWKQRQYWT